jgi:hypothetical protein
MSHAGHRNGARLAAAAGPARRGERPVQKKGCRDEEIVQWRKLAKSVQIAAVG